jgi:hypothetical protein
VPKNEFRSCRRYFVSSFPGACLYPGSRPQSFAGKQVKADTFVAGGINIPPAADNCWAAKPATTDPATINE